MNIFKGTLIHPNIGHFTPNLAQAISSLCSRNLVNWIFLKFCGMVGYYENAKLRT